MNDNYMKTILSGVKEWTENLTDDAIDKANNALEQANKSIDKALFVVNITQNSGGTFSADKTFEEITQAYNEGKYSIVANANGSTLYLAHFSPVIVGFFSLFENELSLFVINKRNDVFNESGFLASTDSKLPNPYPLTFTGAVSGSYDGSSAKTIEIPSGGSGGAVSTLKKVWSFDITETIADLGQIINFAGPVRRIVIICKALEGSTSSASRAGIKFKQPGLGYAETLNINGVVGESGTPIYSSLVFDVFTGGYVCEFLANKSSDFHTWNHTVTTHFYYVNPDRMAEWDAIWFNVWNVSSGSIEIWTDAEVLG